MARSYHRRVEVSSARSETAQTFANANGSMTLEESVAPRWPRRADGSWTAVDPSLRKAADGTVVPAGTVVPTVFSGGGTGPLARLVDGDRELAVSWPIALPTPGFIPAVEVNIAHGFPLSPADRQATLLRIMAERSHQPVGWSARQGARA